MDPTACMKRILDHLHDGERDEAADAARDLLDWIDGNGFAPTFDGMSEQDRKTTALCFAFGVIAGQLTAERC